MPTEETSLSLRLYRVIWGAKGDRTPVNLKTQGRGRGRPKSPPEPHPE